MMNEDHQKQLDEQFMSLALDQAKAAEQRSEVPIGAVIVDSETGEVLAADGNRTRELNDITAHAEVLVIRQAAQKLGVPRLTTCTLYVTLEPCPMCAQAISFARVQRLIYGASDPKGGGVDTGPKIFTQPTCFHRPALTAGVLADPCGDILRTFFKARR
jgi:cytosine deaminase